MNWARVLSFVMLFLLNTPGCVTLPQRSTSTPIPTASSSPTLPPETSPDPTITSSPSQLAFDFNTYRFPGSIDPAKRFLFYLHGKIIEDQGIPAISPEFGEYEIQAILEKFSSQGFVVISAQRPKDTDGVAYARSVNRQVTALLEAGVPASNITVVGASKGAGITIYASHYQDNPELNYVLLAICHPDEVKRLIQDQISLRGNVLSIFDSVDRYAGTCQELFNYSKDKGLASFDEIVLNIGTGHGILYQPLDEWMLPTIQWALDAPH